MFKEIMTMPHIIFGITGIIFAVWAAIEALNSTEQNYQRLKIVSVLTTVCISLSYLLGGWWYVKYYGVKDVGDKFIILKGPWPWAHKFFMEAKEHVFFVLLLLSVLLTIAVFENKIYLNKNIKQLVILIAVLIVLLGLGMEGAGAIITKGVKMGLLGGK